MPDRTIKIIQFEDLISKQSIPALIKGEIHLWSISLDANTELIEHCKLALTNSELNKIHFFKFPKIQNNYIISQGILRHLLSYYLNIAPEKIQLGRHRKGKPLSLDESSLFFNMSNSGNLCVYAFSRDNEIGIDLECIRDLPDLDQLINKNFTENERLFINKNKKERLKRFFLFWTIKESYLKAVGEGMRLTPDNLEFVIENNTIKLISIKGIFEPEDWNFKNIHFSDKYLSTLTFKGNQLRFVEIIIK